jgi:phosphoribosyl-AMP cyclohydrolase
MIDTNARSQIMYRSSKPSFTCVVTDARSGDVLMVAHMNAQALQQTIATGLAREAQAGPRVAPRARGAVPVWA